MAALSLSAQASQRLHFLDGLRGLACFYVLLFHEATQKVEAPGELSPLLTPLYAVLNQGRHSVVFFIVLSGFSLMLPIARAGTGKLVGGFSRYISRRAKRILPPYYVALLLSILLIVGYNQLSARSGGQGIDEAALSPGSLISHLFLFHNLNFDWAFRINGPMWSVATEWQIYFLFALLLLPLWRRIGAGPTVVIAWLLFGLPSLLLDASVNLYWASPWFVGSFALGMYGADLGFGPKAATEGAARAPWRALTYASFALVVAVAFVESSWPYAIVDLGISLFALCWIAWCVQQGQRPGAGKTWVLRLLESRPLVYLGGFSYSLYLVQHPLLRFSEKVFNRLGLGHDANLLLHLLVVTPLIVAAAWLFAELFERPFTTGGVLLPALRRRLGAASPAA